MSANANTIFGTTFRQTTHEDNALGWALLFATNMPATAWSPVADGIAINGDLCTVQLEAVGPQRFLRLRK
jgi:hypothetical protein